MIPIQNILTPLDTKMFFLSHPAATHTDFETNFLIFIYDGI